MIPGHPRVKDLTGQTFYRLRAVSFVGRINRRSYWLCKCECGSTKVIRTTSLTCGRTKSCGCLSKETAKRVMTKHGLANKIKRNYLYNAWHGIKSRCFSTTCQSYENYGGRGITLQSDWVNDPSKFTSDILATLGPRPGPEWSLDRIDNDGNYEIRNLRWATKTVQTQNRRRVGTQQALIDTLRQEIDQLKKTLEATGCQGAPAIAPFQHQRSLFDTSRESFHTGY